jgi:hypothetical protein
MREWDAQADQRLKVILSIILEEVKKVRGIDCSKNDTETFVNPFNNNLDDLEDLGIMPDGVLQRLSRDEFLSADEAESPNEPVIAEGPVPINEPETATEYPTVDESITVTIPATIPANDLGTSNSTLPSVHKLQLPPVKSKVSSRSIKCVLILTYGRKGRN